MAGKKYVDDCGGLKPIVIPKSKSTPKEKKTDGKKKVKRKK